LATGCFHREQPVAVKECVCLVSPPSPGWSTCDPSKSTVRRRANSPEPLQLALSVQTLTPVVISSTCPSLIHLPIPPSLRPLLIQGFIATMRILTTDWDAHLILTTISAPRCPARSPRFIAHDRMQPFRLQPRHASRRPLLHTRSAPPASVTAMTAFLRFAPSPPPLPLRRFYSLFELRHSFAGSPMHHAETSSSS
jgi:hypothetical protein